MSEAFRADHERDMADPEYREQYERVTRELTPEYPDRMAVYVDNFGVPWRFYPSGRGYWVTGVGNRDTRSWDELVQRGPLYRYLAAPAAPPGVTE